MCEYQCMKETPQWVLLTLTATTIIIIIQIFIHQRVVARENIQTYKYGEKQQKAKEKNSEQV